MGTHPIFESDFDCLTEISKMMCGGASDVKPVDDEVRAIFEEIKAELQEKTGITGDFEIHGYKSQLVAGTNYFIRCSAGGKFVHARVFNRSRTQTSPHHSILCFTASPSPKHLL